MNYSIAAMLEEAASTPQNAHEIGIDTTLYRKRPASESLVEELVKDSRRVSLIRREMDDVGNLSRSRESDVPAERASVCGSNQALQRPSISDAVELVERKFEERSVIVGQQAVAPAEYVEVLAQ
jgi:hypothetical protein